MLSFRRLTASCVAALALTGPLGAQDEELVPPAPAQEKGTRITFLPPPIEGHITLGLFDPAGKLAHVLKKNATEADFTVGLNGFITHWDGTNGAGTPLPAATYQARGFSVGDVEVEGVAFHGNDWISSEESPRLTRVVELALDPQGGLLLKAAKPDSVESVRFRYQAETDQLLPLTEAENFPESGVKQLTPGSDPQQVAATAAAGAFLLGDGKLWKVVDGKASLIEFPDMGRVISASSGRDSTVWVIDETPETNRVVKQFSASGESLRALPTDPADPPPVQIAADPTKDAIHLLEVSALRTRVRSLVLEKLEPTVDGDPNAPQISTWRTVLSKSITSSGEFDEAVVSELRGEKFSPAKSINLRLVPNPLFRNQPASVDVKVVATPEGAVLQTADGLPLKQLTETKGLRWVAMSRTEGSKALVMLQSDGAVVEEFRIRKLGQMMAFDAGTYELKR